MSGIDRKTNLVLAGILTAAVIIPGLTQAADPSSAMNNPFESFDEFNNLTVVSQSELAEMRGGLVFGGLQMEFGANARTFIDGVLALETVITFNDSGPVVQQVTPSSAGASSALAGLSVVLGDGAGTALQGLLPSNVDLSALTRGANGVVLNDSKGLTTALHQVTQDRIVSVLVNTANDRHIRQELDVRVDIPNFKQFQQAVGNAILNSRIADTINR